MKTTRLTIAILALAANTVMAEDLVLTQFITTETLQNGETRELSSISRSSDHFGEDEQALLDITTENATDKATLILKEGGSFADGYIHTTIKNGVHFINNGTIDLYYKNFFGRDAYDSIELQAGSTMTNNGVYKGSVFVQNNSTLIVTEGSSLSNGKITLGSTDASSTGILQIEGAVTINNSILGDNGVLIFEKGSTLTSTKTITLNEVNIVVKVDDSVMVNPINTTLDLFGSDTTVKGLENATFTLSNADGTKEQKVIVSSAADGSITVMQAIPEPTTATLSLLALCGLALRRRRI